MGIFRRMLGYASFGGAVVTAHKALETDSLMDGMFAGLETGLLAEAARNLLEGEFFPEEEYEEVEAEY